MRSPLGAFIFIAIMILLDTYVFRAIKTVCLSASPKTKTIVYALYWSVTILAVIGFLLFVFSNQDFLPKKLRTYLFATILGLFFAKIIAAVFFLIDDIRRGIQWVVGKLFYSNTEVETISSDV
ncbi:MAG: hypothetical protein WDM71_09700 [Ferruginibacter sp.]